MGGDQPDERPSVIQMSLFGFAIGCLGATLSLLLLRFGVQLASSTVAPRADNANPAPKLGTFFLVLFTGAKIPILGFVYLQLARHSEAAKTGFLVGFGLVYSLVVGTIAVKSARL